MNWGEFSLLDKYELERLKERLEKKCYVCGNKKELQIHHKHRLSEGGEPFDIDNVIMLCSKCHQRLHKKNKDLNGRLERMKKNIIKK